MYYTVYKTTNSITGRFYIGCHKTSELNDDYFGSGKYLNRAIARYGKENFYKEILYVFDNADDMFAKEAELVTEDVITEGNTYNIKAGGFGGWDYVNYSKKNVYSTHTERSRENMYKGHEKLRELKADPEYMENLTHKIVETKIKRFGTAQPGCFKGKTHTSDTKRKIGQANSKKQQGRSNSQYGTMWITDGKQCKKIQKDSVIPTGWYKGRK